MLQILVSPKIILINNKMLMLMGDTNAMKCLSNVRFGTGLESLDSDLEVERARAELEL